MGKRRKNKKREWNDCKRKSRYKDEATALWYAKRLTEKRGKLIEVYPCQLCKGWHLTSHESMWMPKGGIYEE